MSVGAAGVGGGGVALTVNPAQLDTPANVPQMFVDVAGPAVVVTAKVALEAPAGTVTLAGTMTRSGSPLERLTVVPPDGATTLNLTVPVAEPPAVTLDGVTVTPASTGGGGGGAPCGFTVNVAVSVTPPPATEIVTGVDTETDEVKMSNPP